MAQRLVLAIVTTLYPALAEVLVQPLALAVSELVLVPDQNSIAPQDAWHQVSAVGTWELAPIAPQDALHLIGAVGAWELFPLQPFQQTLVVRP